jgi:hypothetical protein
MAAGVLIRHSLRLKPDEGAMISWKRSGITQPMVTSAA